VDQNLSTLVPETAISSAHLQSAGGQKCACTIDAFVTAGSISDCDVYVDAKREGRSRKERPIFRLGDGTKEVQSRIDSGSNLFPDAAIVPRGGWFAEHLSPEKNGPLHDSPTRPGSGMQTMSRGKPGNELLVDAAKTPASRSLRVIARAISD
jgi:hypothetical protein